MLFAKAFWNRPKASPVFNAGSLSADSSLYNLPILAESESPGSGLVGAPHGREPRLMRPGKNMRLHRTKRISIFPSSGDDGNAGLADGPAS